MTEIEIVGKSLVKTILREGSGTATPPPNSKVHVHYVGTLLDGKKFDSSRDRGEPFVFDIGQSRVIKGWDVGVATMRKGELAVLTCAPDYAYGSAGAGKDIPPNATLKFEVELLHWEDENDFFSDGNVTRTILESSSMPGGKKPGNGSVAKINFVVKAKDGSVLDNSFETTPFELTVEEGSEKCCLSLCLKLMTATEKNKLSIEPPYKLGHGIDFPKDVGVDVEIQLLHHTKIVDVSKDGRVMKKCLSESDGWEMATDGAVIKYQYRVKSRDSGAVLFDSSTTGDCPQTTCGSGELIEAFDFIFADMKEGEVSEFVVDASVAYSELYPPPSGVPANESIVLEVSLVKVDKGVEPFNLSVPDLIAASEQKKRKGNDFFAAGNVKRALRFYERSTEMLSIKGRGEGQDAQDKAAKAKAKVPGYLNTAACHIKLQNWKECAAVCEKALKIDSRNVKALYRLSQALLELAELSDAKRQVDKLLEIDPANADAAKLLAKIKRLQSAQDQKDKKLFAAMFK